MTVKEIKERERLTIEQRARLFNLMFFYDKLWVFGLIRKGLKGKFAIQNVQKDQICHHFLIGLNLPLNIRNECKFSFLQLDD